MDIIQNTLKKYPPPENKSMFLQWIIFRFYDAYDHADA